MTAAESDLVKLAVAWVECAERSQSLLMVGGDQLMTASRNEAQAESAFREAAQALADKLSNLQASNAEMRKALEPLLQAAAEKEDRIWGMRFDAPQDAECEHIKLTWAQINAIRRASASLETEKNNG